MNERKHILVIDDDEGIRKMCSSILTKAGYKVDSAGDGSEAMEIIVMLKETPPDLVLTDVRMDPIDGILVAKTIRGDGRTPGLMPKVPIIFMSGDLGRYQQRDLLPLSPYLLDKPYHAEDLLRMVSWALYHQPEPPTD